MCPPSKVVPLALQDVPLPDEPGQGSPRELCTFEASAIRETHRVTEAVWVVIGVQASGKSTVADLLAHQFERGVHIRGGSRALSRDSECSDELR